MDSDSDFYSFKQLVIPVPPKEEQNQIVRYLDWQVSNINKLIHGYQKQIERALPELHLVYDNIRFMNDFIF